MLGSLSSLVRSTVENNNPINKKRRELAGRGDASRAQGRRTRQSYEHGVRTFDPREYMREAANALFANASDAYGSQIGQIDAQNNARGFYNSPVGRAGARRSFDDYLGRGLAGLSGQAAQLEQNRLGMMGGLYAMDRDDTRFYEDADIGLMMTREQQRLADKASKRSMWGTIASGIGSIGGAAIIAASDRTLKKKVKRGKKVLPRARRLRGESWEWNEKGRKVTGDAKGARRSGVMAQDVEAEFPELVSTNPATGTKQVDYGGLASTLVNAIGELAEEVDELKAGRAGSALVG